MPRSTQQLHPFREPVATRPAATVLLLRDATAAGGAGGIEVLMTRRSDKASFAPGAYVFPGGGIDALDAAPDTHAAADRRPTQSDLHLTQAIAAIRESFEELGVLLARHADGPRQGQMADAQDIAAIDRHQPFVAQCAARGLRLAADGVFLLAHWITDRDLPRRFDVPFLVARMPDGQIPVADEAEQFEPVWVRPADALARHEAGQFFIIFPTIRTLDRLKSYPDVASRCSVRMVGKIMKNCPASCRASASAGRTQTGSNCSASSATGSWPSGMRATRNGTSKRRGRSRSVIQWASMKTLSAASRRPRAVHCATKGWWRSMAAMSCASAINPLRGPPAWRASSTPSSSKLSRMAAMAWVRCRSLCVGRRSAAECDCASSASMPPPGNT